MEQPRTLVLSDIVTVIEAIVQAKGNRHEVIHIPNAIFSIHIHTDDQNQFALYVMGCNTPL